MSTTTAPRCTFPGINGKDGPCNRAMLVSGVSAPICPVHDRIRCTAAVTRGGQPSACGHQLKGGCEAVCPSCGKSVRLHDTLRGQQ
jgi:hypothetical protein